MAEDEQAYEARIAAELKTLPRPNLEAWGADTFSNVTITHTGFVVANANTATVANTVSISAGPSIVAALEAMGITLPAPTKEGL